MERFQKLTNTTKQVFQKTITALAILHQALFKRTLNVTQVQNVCMYLTKIVPPNVLLATCMLILFFK